MCLPNTLNKTVSLILQLIQIPLLFLLVPPSLLSFPSFNKSYFFLRPKLSYFSLPLFLNDSHWCLKNNLNLSIKIQADLLQIIPVFNTTSHVSKNHDLACLLSLICMSGIPPLTLSTLRRYFLKLFSTPKIEWSFLKLSFVWLVYKWILRFSQKHEHVCEFAF